MPADKQERPEQQGGKAGRRALTAVVVFLGLGLVMFFMSSAARYDWVKAFHVIAVMSWMAGMLYLPRLFVYHCDAVSGSEQDRTFIVMERRLLKIIMTPAMLISWALGLWLAWAAGAFAAPWFWGKLLAVALMTAAHFYLASGSRAFADGRNKRSARHWRLINEVPTLAMIAAVIFVIVKPF